METLHPNLARIAASYQQILGRLSRGELDLVRAHDEIRDLIARDDEGIQWTINPRDGGWMFLSRTGAWMPAEPPRSGFATVTPHDLRRHMGEEVVAYDPDWDLQIQKVEPGSGTLKGVTTPSTPPQSSRALVWVLLAALGLAGALWFLAADRSEQIAPGAPATTAVSQ